jgi:hypothetical protein
MQGQHLISFNAVRKLTWVVALVCAAAAIAGGAILGRGPAIINEPISHQSVKQTAPFNEASASVFS